MSGDPPVDAAEYCRQIETYLCRKNEGHLIRIAGPVFAQVTGWAEQGVPLAVAFRGIDQYCERYYAKGPRRRPVRIEFCEGDILSLFDDWRRAVGVSAIGVGETAPARTDTLPAHIERSIARLTTMRGRAPSPEFDSRLAAAVRELDALRGSAKHARGDARESILQRLAQLDAELLRAVETDLDPAARRELTTTAEAEIAPFAARMPSDARQRAIDAAYDRLVRDRAGLPALSHESSVR